MSSTVRTPWRRARSSASELMRWVCSVERWVPVMTRARAEATKSSAHVPLLDGHVGAVLAVEEVREGVAVLDAQHHQGGEPLRVHRDVAGVAALGRQGLGQEPAHGVVADPGGQRRPQAQARAPDGDVGGGAAQVLGEGGGVLEARADLLRRRGRRPGGPGRSRRAADRSSHQGLRLRRSRSHPEARPPARHAVPARIAERPGRKQGDFRAPIVTQSHFHGTPARTLPGCRDPVGARPGPRRVDPGGTAPVPGGRPGQKSISESRHNRNGGAGARGLW